MRADFEYTSFAVTTASSNLVLTTEKRQYGSKAYTSGRVWAKGRFSFTYRDRRASWIGHPDSSVQFPQQFKIDYVRVYQDAALG